MLATSVLGVPAVSVPTGVHDGVPLGVQIIGGRYCEEFCLDAAKAVETRLGLSSPVAPLAARDGPGGRFRPPT